MHPFFGALEAIKSWLEFRRAVHVERADKIRDSLLALHRAANETRSYLAELRMRQLQDNFNPRNRDQDRERRLADLWATAGSEVSRFGEEGRDLYRRCFDKAEYWSDPFSWQGQEARDAGIALDRLVDDIQTFIDDGGRIPL